MDYVTKIFIASFFFHLVMSQSSQKTETQTGNEKKDFMTENLQRLQSLLQKKLSSNSISETSSTNPKSKQDLENSSRKAKSLPYFPFFPPPMVPFAPPPGYYYPQKKDIVENSYPNEWLSRTEPFKKNPLVDSPTYYIRLPPNPYVFIPGVGYVSRPPALSDPEILETSKPDQRPNHIGSDIVPDPFYRLPINFISNGKPTSVYQLPNGHGIPKPESPFVNLDKGPYVFNGKPSEIFLVAQIYDALYGDELTHFYP